MNKSEKKGFTEAKQAVWTLSWFLSEETAGAVEALVLPCLPGMLFV